MGICAAPSIFSILHLCSVGANIVRPREINDLPYILRLRRLRHGHLSGVQHIFNENAVARGGIVDKNVGHRAHQLAVLDNRAAAHECVQVGTTVFTKISQR